MKTLALIALLAAGAWASDEHEGAGSARTGKGKAVLEATEERGLKLSEKAAKRLGIKTAKLASPSRIPKTALVQSAEETSVFVVRDGWFKRVHADDLKGGEMIVIAGAPLLRVAELDVLGSEEAGHDH
jgi:hypothetical protein